MKTNSTSPNQGEQQKFEETINKAIMQTFPVYIKESHKALHQLKLGK